MLCIDWKDDYPVEILGSEFDSDYSRLEVLLLPCNYLHTMLGYQGDSISDECVGSLEEQIKYLGPSHFFIYMNQEQLNPYKYEDQTITRFSELKNL